jgi:protein SCO1/2
MKRAKRHLIHVMSFAIILSLWVAVLPAGLSAHEGEEQSGNTQEEESSESQREALKEGDPAPPFVLTDQDRKQIGLSDFNGRPRFLVFIYTHCKDLCPLILQNRDHLEAEAEPSIGKGIVFLAVTLDPQNDTPEVLRAFVKKIGVDTRDLHLLSGPVRKVEKVLDEYEIGVIQDGAGGQVMGHTSVGYAIDRDGIIRAIYNFSF